MSTSEAFLSDIIEHPDDDAPRLIYADWLDDNDDPERAEFIRVQCALAKMAPDDERYSELEARQIRLVAEFGASWTPVPCRAAGRVAFRRGFIEHFSAGSVSQLLECTEVLGGTVPIRELGIGYLREEAETRELASQPWLRRLHTLSVGYPFEEAHDVFDTIAAAPLENLTTLILRGEINDDDLARLLGHPPRSTFARLLGRPHGSATLPASLAKLRRLSLSGWNLTERGVRLLLVSPLAQTLTHLSLTPQSDCSSAVIHLLMSSPLWSRLEEVSLSGYHPLRAEDIAALIEALPRSRLRRLSLPGMNSQAQIDRLSAAFAGATSLGRLEALDLSQCQLCGDTLQRFLRCPALHQLRELRLGQGFAEGDIARLASCPGLSNLVALSVTGAHWMNEADLEALLSAPWSNLVCLDLRIRALSDHAVAVLSRSPVVLRVRVLHLPGHLGEGSLLALGESPRLGRLTRLHLHPGIDRLTEAAVSALLHSERLPNLASVECSLTESSDRIRQTVRANRRIAWEGDGGFETIDLDNEEARAAWPAPLLATPALAPDEFDDFFPWLSAQ